MKLNNEDFQHSIILTGPFGIGKSEIAKFLATTIGWPHYSLDESYWSLLDAYPPEELREIQSLPITSPQRQPYHPIAIDTFLSKHSDPNINCIFDFGFVHTVLHDEDHIEQTKSTFAKFQNVILLVPTEDRQESLNLMVSLNRKYAQYKPTIYHYSNEILLEYHKYVINCDAVWSLAKIVIYTDGKSLSEISDEILQHATLPG